MKIKLTFFVVLVAAMGGNAFAQAVRSSPNFETRQGTVAANKVVYGADHGVKCDGATNDRVNIQATLDDARQNSRVVLPPGTCITDGITLDAYDGSWIECAGKYSTVIRRANGTNAATPMLTLGAGGSFGTVGNVMITNCGFDGNASSQTVGNHIIYGTNAGKFTFKDDRFVNSFFSAINLAPTGTNTASDGLVADNDFENNGRTAGNCATAGACADVLIAQPLRVRVLRNRSDSSQNFFLGSSNNGVGQLEIGDNIVNNCQQFAVALGGGPTNNASGAKLFHNFFNCPAGTQNTVDVALWNDVTVDDATVFMGAGGGIVDGPPAQKVSVTNSHVFGSAAASGIGINLGGSDLEILGNTVIGCGGSGIGISVPAGTVQNGVSIKNNIARNNSRFAAGNSGIQFYLGAGASLSTVTVQGNESYDTQGTPTQAYGIAIASNGQTTGFSNFTIEGNDLRGNKLDGIFNGATSTSGFLVQNNVGDTTVGVCASSASPSTCGVAQSGSVAIANPATTIQVNTTAVTAASKILVFEDSTLGTVLTPNMTCNTTLGRTYAVTMRTPGTSFVITASATPAANSACLSWMIVPAN